NYDDDIVPLSQKHDGGSITERHIIYALALKINNKIGKGQKTLDFLKKQLKLNVSAKNSEYLLEIDSENYTYDLLGVLKSDFVERFFIPATDECPPVREVIALANETGAISAYAYLGDVTNSVTGDKKAQTFEDGFLDELFSELKKIGFNAVTYMPSRNTKDQLDRLRKLCDEYGFFQISGEDINSPRQSFICYAQRAPEFRNLYDATFALIGHEKAATENLTKAFFSENSISETPSLQERIQKYKTLVLYF
ncbi:MAG: hypothetical protein PHE70_10000, partial [Tepidanaerobacteraceae bacterium]|nr:hypothetical protein [Tepidanaerobacteraceae bacterium]